MSKRDEKDTGWPRYLPYTPVAMGMIQPEWMFMSHFFEEEEEETENAGTGKDVPAEREEAEEERGDSSPSAGSVKISIRARKGT
ncbi:hypothetical protein [Staphylospora marina]|uniref:hypothetical protein n=1 Tax=Staphylospora marina TaxID=2490858 RepID=UPI000F5BC543|nr:hypothetical protein [Staphylospora marina]